MPREIDVVPTQARDLRAIAASMRAADAAEAMAMGMTPERALWGSFHRSIFCHTAFVDGRAAAVFGLCGNLLDEVGFPWLATTPAIELIPKTFVRCARLEVGLMLAAKPRLVNWVDASYYRAQRLLTAIGFTLSAPEPFGPNGEPFRKFEKVRDGFRSNH